MLYKYQEGWEPEEDESIFDGNNIRYVLGKKGKKPFVILCMNPSRAKIKESDRTVNAAIEYAKNNGYDGYYILNIYPEYATDSCKIEKIEGEIVNTNCAIIKKLLIEKKPSEIILAYGNMDKCKKIDSEMQESKNKILEIIKEHKINAKHFGTLTKKGNPRHLSRMAKYNFNKSRLNIFISCLVIVFASLPVHI